MENCNLTAREVEIVRLLSEGGTYASIAECLGISKHTVGSHIKAVYRKLGVHSSAAAVFNATAFLQEGLTAGGAV